MDKKQLHMATARSGHYNHSHQAVFIDGWAACLEANGIGEEPEDKAEPIFAETLEAFAYSVTRFSHVFNESMKKGIERANEENRIPAWKPKDGESVMFEYGGIPLIGTFHKGLIYCESHVYPHAEDKCRPVDYDRIGKPWSEIV